MSKVKAYLSCLNGAAFLASLLLNDDGQAPRKAIEEAILSGNFQAVYDAMSQAKTNDQWEQWRDEWLAAAREQLNS